MPEAEKDMTNKQHLLGSVEMYRGKVQQIPVPRISSSLPKRDVAMLTAILNVVQEPKCNSQRNDKGTKHLLLRLPILAVPSHKLATMTLAYSCRDQHVATSSSNVVT